MFSARVPSDLRTNRLSAAVWARRASGRSFIDLTQTNPTAAGIRYPENLLAPLASAEAMRYAPEPFGLAAARLAVAGDYARRGTRVAAERVVLTASTSEAYSVLFKLLCDPGDDVLIPIPSYPLFDHLSRLDAIQTRTYPLEYHGRWMVDEHSVDAVWTPTTRAVLAVSPNNPTGSTLSGEEWAMLGARCAERDAALIVDEVFADYPLTESPEPGTWNRESGTGRALTFRLGGLSKSAGLPQVKLGWIAVEGPAPLVGPALERLEIVCDAYLSVSTPVQLAAADLIAGGAEVRAAILARVRENWTTLTATAAGYPAIEVLRADAGWSAVIRIPSTRPEEDVVLALLDEDGVLVHPGYFFDFPCEAFLIVSLLPPADQFENGVRRVMDRVHG